MPLLGFDLISGGTTSFAYLDGFSFSKFNFDEINVKTAEGDERFRENNETLALKIQDRIQEVLTQNIDLDLNRNNTPFLEIKMVIEFEHGSKIQRLYSFILDGRAEVDITLFGLDKYGREVFFIKESTSLSHAVFGGDYKNEFDKSLNNFTKILNSILTFQRNQANQSTIPLMRQR